MTSTLESPRTEHSGIPARLTVKPVPSIHSPELYQACLRGCCADCATEKLIRGTARLEPSRICRRLLSPTSLGAAAAPGRRVSLSRHERTRHRIRRLWALSLLSLAPSACGKTVDRSSLSQSEASVDSGAPQDAEISSHVDAKAVPGDGSDAPVTQEGGATDAIAVSDDGGYDDAIAEPDRLDPADTSVPIPCVESTTCTAATQLPSIYGGVNGGVNEIATISGQHSDWYELQVKPYPQGTTNGVVNVVLRIVPPADVEFDMDVYLATTADYPTTCAQPTASSAAAPGQPQTATVNWPAQDGFGGVGWVTVHVIAKTASSCESNRFWNLTITGD